jgi:hypothetical protein
MGDARPIMIFATEPFYFICYSSLDLATAIKLADQLTAGPPSIAVWLDKRKIQPGLTWETEIANALRDCAGVLYLMSEDSVSENSECQQEWKRALTYKKPIIPLLFEKSAELPYRLAPRQYISFTDNFEAGLAKLRDHLRWRVTDEGALHALKERLEDAKRDLKRASEGGGGAYFRGDWRTQAADQTTAGDHHRPGCCNPENQGAR